MKIECIAIKANGTKCTSEAWVGTIGGKLLTGPEVTQMCSTHKNQLRRQEVKLAIKEGRAHRVTVKTEASPGVIAKNYSYLEITPRTEEA